MATDETLIVHPGDILQDNSGQFFLAVSTHSWGVGAVQRWTVGGEVREAYHRLRPGQFVVVGAAHTLPVEVAQARRDSIAATRAFDREGDGNDNDMTPEWDVEVRFNGRTTGSGQKHFQRVRADCVEQALDVVRAPVMEHGGSICVVGVTVDEVKR